MKRLFLGIPLPTNILKQLSNLYEPLETAKWVEPINFHITLQFLGNIDYPTQVELHEKLITIKKPMFSIRLNGINNFSNGLLYANIEQSNPLVELHKKIFNRIQPLKIKLEKRKYKPHITLARIKQINELEFIRYMKKHALFQTESFQITNFLMYSSILSPKGPTYHEEMSYNLIK